MHSPRLAWPAAMALSLVVLASPHSPTHAEDPGAGAAPVPTDRLTVRAHARATAPADDLELEIVVEAGSDDAQDAEKKHRQKLNRVLAALTGKETEKPKKSDEDDDEDDSSAKKKRKKKSDDDDAPAKKSKDEDAKTGLPTPGAADADGMVFEVREGRSTVGVQGGNEQNQDDNGQQNGEKRTEGEIRVGTAVVVAFRNISKVAPRRLHKLVALVIDKATEKGADMGGSKTNVKPAIRFRVKDPEALKRKAYADAVTRGRARAEELARLSNRTLGKVSCVTELEPTAAPANQVPEGWPGFVASLGTNDPGNDDGVSTSSEVTVDIALQVEFDLK